HHAFSSGAGRTSDGNGSHASTLKSPSYTKSVSWQHYLAIGQEFDVLFAKPSDPELESKIDQAYLKKYSGSSYVSAMTGIRARAATIEILPS
ncbi:DUF2255 family protein, partial [Klebsiella pneumoniae]|uniref:DUF2255 family protein n=1 Tax=Klebsiella pneumoniae TaxID=573 RepID=UPI001EE94E40